MNQAEIRLKRTESLLKELIPEALGALDDMRINSLNVTHVACSKGRYDARVFLDPGIYSEAEQKDILKQLRKASGYLKIYVKDTLGWHNSPNFAFEFYDELERINRMDTLFKQIGKSIGDES